ncbi:hypothetical protein ScPMuIL_018042 [Solemya velum]
MEISLSGKLAVVTGGSRGLGRGFATSLLEKGAKVVILDIGKEEGEETLKKLQEQFGKDNVYFYRCDVTDRKQFEDTMATIDKDVGRLSVMVNNAGIFNEQDWEKMISINLVAMIRGTKLATDLMKKDNGGDGGVVLNISSIAGLGWYMNSEVYCASKFGVVGFTKSMALNSDTLKWDIRYLCMCPAFADTALIGAIKESTGLHKEVDTGIEKAGGILSVQEVADGFMKMILTSDNGGLAVISKMGLTYKQDEQK